MKNKKIICLLLMIVSLFSLSAKSYEIETSRGIQKVSIPKGYTIEDSFLEMSKLYLEERFDHEDLLEVSENLTLNINKYKKEIENLNFLYEKSIKENEQLKDLYKEKSKVKIVVPSFGISAISSKVFSFDAGIILFERFQITTVLSYPLAFGLRFGFTL